MTQPNHPQVDSTLLGAMPNAVVVPPASAPSDSNNSQTPIALPKVLHLINGEHYSGAERVQDLLAGCLPRFGYEVGFACLKPLKFPSQRMHQDVPLYETPMRSRFDVGVVRQIGNALEDGNYAALHAHTPRTLMLGALVAKTHDVPLIYHVHSPTSRDSTRRFQNWLNTKIENWGIQSADHLITVSHSLADHIQGLGVDADRITVVQNGVPITSQRRSEEVPQQPWTIGTVALFRPRKGTEILLRAVAQLRAAGHLVRIHAVGPFETEQYESQVKALANELGIADAIYWTGFTRDVSAELTKMDLFALPSIFGEGLPMVVLEAMAAGVPVVGTRVEGVPEAVRHELDGVLATPNDPYDFALAIQRVMEDLDWSQLQTNAMDRHAKRFSDASMSEGIADVYRKLGI